MPEEAERLLQLVHSFLMVSFAVEVWRQPEVIHCGSARIDRTVEVPVKVFQRAVA